MNYICTCKTEYVDVVQLHLIVCFGLSRV